MRRCAGNLGDHAPHPSPFGVPAVASGPCVSGPAPRRSRLPQLRDWALPELRDGRVQQAVVGGNPRLRRHPFKPTESSNPMSDAAIIRFPRRSWEPWVDKAAVARHLGFSPRWVEIKMNDAGLPHDRAPGSNRPRYRLSQVDAWFEQYKHELEAGR